MLSFAIIVFREALEIALVLGALFAGTRGMRGKIRWVAAGFALGIAGAGIVALFTDRISEAFDGTGQETFQAIVLLVAAVLIGSTVVWMKLQAKTMVSGLRQAASEIKAGKRPLYALALIVSLAVLRDGAEIVLLAHGVLASGQPVANLVVGGLVGLTAGTIVGGAIYYGIIKAAARHIFTVTSWLLVLLAAAMASQATAFLTAVDIVPTIVYPLWDTSWLLSEGSFVGQTLHILVGYTSKPSGAQALAYLATFALIGICLRWAGRAASARAASPLPAR